MMDKLTAVSDPVYYTIIDYVRISTKLVGLSNSLGGHIYLILFQDKNLELPNSIPLGMYYCHGDRKYMFLNMILAEVDVNYKMVLNNLYQLKNAVLNKYELAKIETLLQQYSSLQSPQSGHPSGTFCRALYKPLSSPPQTIVSHITRPTEITK